MLTASNAKSIITVFYLNWNAEHSYFFAVWDESKSCYSIFTLPVVATTTVFVPLVFVKVTVVP